MKKFLSCFTAAALLALTNVVFAAPKTVTLDVPGMTCALCPITVKKALMKVPGVANADVRYEAKQAVVTYDDAKTAPDALMQATGNAGYPSTVKGGK
jgi:mercuric ion binding protein